MCVAAQTFAEKLFARLQKGSGEKFETRMALMTLVSRVIGVHKLLLLNFYPFMQRYLQPHQRDVPQLLATLVQVCLFSSGPEINDNSLWPQVEYACITELPFMLTVCLSALPRLPRC